MRRKRSSSGIIIMILLILLTALLAYLYNSKIFERNVPSVELLKKIDWNLKKPIAVKISDESGIKFVRATLSDGKNSIVLLKKLFEISQEEFTLNIEFPRTGFVSNKKHFELTIEAVDSSKWNFFSGNKAVKTSIINVDTKRPELFIVNNSYKILKGGVATVVFKAKDENLKELYIQTNFDKRFYPTPFYKDDHYVSLLAWPSDKKNFKATIIAQDKAGNISKSRVRFYLKGKKYKVSKLKLSDNFLNGKIADLAEEELPSAKSMDKIERFKYVNEDLRDSNEKVIEEVTSEVPTEKINGFSLKPFYPLKNAAAVASFGDHRFFSYEKKQVSESYHLGLDLASTAEADVIASNSGTVVFAKYNGIYGKNIIISHGLGVYSLYGHNSSFLVDEGENVKAGQVISKTGVTGLALGDHLHFGILVQGVEVRPEEWMDKNWMKDNVFDVMKSAKKIIDR
ncbi:M23 family metallopeptidase [Sulfurospirillum arcachonense]|uniref:M23 family metallopeptidase n=1 Tax=Sulfurospirillum arcachonense TaxID=57666 RepID=UPI000468EFD1|nr:M23 family metallopeptidase [Sulfurospirillum arcachonense]